MYLKGHWGCGVIIILGFHHLPSLQPFLPMASRPEVSTQFTEDTFAKQDHYCEWPKCRALIRQGEPEFYIATILPGQCGRVVCANCNLYYLSKPSTTVC